MTKEEKLLVELKVAIENGDNEGVHSIYDELIKRRLSQHEPSFIRRLDKLVEGISFWYA